MERSHSYDLLESQGEPVVVGQRKWTRLFALGIAFGALFVVVFIGFAGLLKIGSDELQVDGPRTVDTGGHPYIVIDPPEKLALTATGVGDIAGSSRFQDIYDTYSQQPAQGVGAVHFRKAYSSDPLEVLKQIQEEAVAEMAELAHSDQPPIPGFDHFGVGFDEVAGVFTSIPFVSLSYTDKSKSWVDTKGRAFTIPSEAEFTDRSLGIYRPDRDVVTFSSGLEYYDTILSESTKRSGVASGTLSAAACPRMSPHKAGASFGGMYNLDDCGARSTGNELIGGAMACPEGMTDAVVGRTKCPESPTCGANAHMCYAATAGATGSVRYHGSFQKDDCGKNDIANPLTGAPSCPEGTRQVLKARVKASESECGANQFVCVVEQPDSASGLSFGGGFQTEDYGRNQVANPLTGGLGCPPNYAPVTSGRVRHPETNVGSTQFTCVTREDQVDVTSTDQDVLNELVAGNSMGVARAMYTAYDLEIKPGNSPELSRWAKRALEVMPADYNEESKPVYKEFLKMFGTGFISKGSFGGMAELVALYRSCLNGQMGGSDISEQVSLDLDTDLIGSHGPSDKYVSKRFNRLMRFYGGNPEVTGQEWASTILTNPVPIKYELQDISNLIPGDSSKAKVNIQAAIRDHIAEFIQSTHQFDGRNLLRQAMDNACLGRCTDANVCQTLPRFGSDACVTC